MCRLPIARVWLGLGADELARCAKLCAELWFHGMWLAAPCLEEEPARKTSARPTLPVFGRESCRASSDRAHSDAARDGCAQRRQQKTAPPAEQAALPKGSGRGHGEFAGDASQFVQASFIRNDMSIAKTNAFVAGAHHLQNARMLAIERSPSVHRESSLRQAP